MTVWDTADLADARRAVWADGDWAGGIDHCRAMIEPHLTLRDRTVAVDIGCGIGRLLHPIADSHRRSVFYGLDTSQAMIDHARRGMRPNVTCVRGGSEAVADLTPIDAAWSVVTFQHLPAPEQNAYVRAVAAALAHGGRFRFQFVPAGDTGPLCHPVPEQTMVGWCRTAGLDPAVDGDPLFPTWRWVTAVKP